MTFLEAGSFQEGSESLGRTRHEGWAYRLPVLLYGGRHAYSAKARCAEQSGALLADLRVPAVVAGQANPKLEEPGQRRRLRRIQQAVQVQLTYADDAAGLEDAVHRAQCRGRVAQMLQHRVYPDRIEAVLVHAQAFFLSSLSSALLIFPIT